MYMKKPLMFDLFCGLGGATEGFLAEDWQCIGIDIERHQYGNHRYPAQLWIQDILTISGSQLREADFLWASPPCQEYSWMAMPWSRAKAHATTIRADTTGAEMARLNRLFDACFRIQREACEAAGRHIPMIVENVKGAQPWVGRARWMFGSFALWGDVPALMPITARTVKVGMGSWRHPDDPRHIPGLGFNTHADRNCRDEIKNNGGSWFNGRRQNPDGRKKPSRCDCAHPETTASGFAAINVDCPIHGDVDCGPTITTCFPSSRSAGADPMWRRGFQATAADQLGREVLKEDGNPHLKLMPIPQSDGRKGVGSGSAWFHGNQGQYSSKSNARKMASAMIAKIPEPLSRHIARTFKPR
jgi:C-5 cytosine-specific DNA methylase